MRTLLVILVVAACSRGSSSTRETSCSTDADCVVVETACCDHCNGGKAEAFNRAFADAHQPKGCDGTLCNQTGCGEAVARCNAGTCAVTILPLQ